MEWSEKIQGVLAALGSAASWAVGAILFKRLGETMSSYGMTLAKAVISVVLLGMIVAVIGFEAMDQRTIWILAVSGLVGIALGDSFFFKALQDLGPVSMLVLMVLGQVMMILVGVFWFGESPGSFAWAGIVCIILGVTVTLSADLGGEARPSGLRGLAYGLASVLCMVVGLTIAKGPLEHSPSMQSTFVRMVAGAVGVFAGGLLTGSVGGWITPLKEKSFLARFLLAVSVVTFGGFWLSMHAIKHLDVAIANTLNSTEPIFVLPLAYYVLHEKLSTRAVAGALIAVAGVALILLPSNPPL